MGAMFKECLSTLVSVDRAAQHDLTTWCRLESALDTLMATVARWEEAASAGLLSSMQLSVGLDLVAEAALTVPAAAHAAAAPALQQVGCHSAVSSVPTFL